MLLLAIILYITLVVALGLQVPLIDFTPVITESAAFTRVSACARAFLVAEVKRASHSFSYFDTEKLMLLTSVAPKEIALSIMSPILLIDFVWITIVFETSYLSRFLLLPEYV